MSEAPTGISAEAFGIAALAEKLRAVKAFSELSPEDLEWFLSKTEVFQLKPGEFLVREGDPAAHMFVVLEGEMRGRRETGGVDGPVFTSRAGDVTGILPFSRMTHYGITGFGTVASFAKALKLDDDVSKLEAAVKDMHSGDDMMSELAESAVNVEAVEG